MATPEMLQPAVQLIELEHSNHHLHRINKLGIKQDVSSIFGKKYKPKIIISTPTLAGSGTEEASAAPDPRPYACMFCPAAFKTEAALVNHVRVHVGAGAPGVNGAPPAVGKQIVHSCLYCNRSFKQATNLEIHVRTYHPYGDGSNGQQINYNQAGLNAAYMMNQAGLALWEYKNQEHQQQQQQQQEENSGEETSEGNNNQTSQNSHSNVVQVKVEKGENGMTVAQQWDKVTRQLTTAYSVERPYTCDYCNKCFKQEAHLKQHVRIHTDDRPYGCPFCGKAFRQKAVLNQHVRLHTGEKPYTCEHCGDKFRQMTTLKLHTRKHLSETLSLSPGSTSHLVGGGYREIVRFMKTGVPQSEHEQAANVLAAQIAQMQQTQSNGPPKPRGVGRPPGSTNRVTTQHMDTLYYLERPYTCHHCNKCFKQEAHLKLHERTHSDYRPFGCGYCGKAFRLKAILQQHERLHTGEKPYACSICGEAFRQMTTLKLHARKHEVELALSGQVTPNSQSVSDVIEQVVSSDA